MHISDCCQFSDIHISQGSVATHLRCGGIFKYEFVANLPMSLPVKEFWKSVNIWGSYGQEFSVLFFLRHSVCIVCYPCGVTINDDDDDKNAFGELCRHTFRFLYDWKMEQMATLKRHWQWSSERSWPVWTTVRTQREWAGHCDDLIVNDVWSCAMSCHL